MKEDRPRRKHDTPLVPVADQPIDRTRLGRATGSASATEPFNSVPPPDEVRLAKEIRSAVKTGVIELQKFSDSIRRGSSPAWPRAEILDRLARQIEHFRLISDRRPGASPMQRVTDMDHRWKSLCLRQTLDNAVSQLEKYKTKRFPSPRCASTIQIVRPSESRAET